MKSQTDDLARYLNIKYREFSQSDSSENSNIRNKIKDTAIAIGFRKLNNIIDVSKKLPLVTKESVFFEDLEALNRRSFDTLVLDSYSMPYDGFSEKITVTFLSSNLEKLTQWFNNSKHMLETEKIIYLPRIEETAVPVYLDEAGFFGDAVYEESKHWNVINTEKFFRATTDASVIVSDRTLVPLFNFDIPCIESVTPSQLSLLMDDYPEDLLRFRNYLQEKLLELKYKLGSENFARGIRLIELDVNDRLFQLRDNLKKLKRVSAVVIIGAQFVTWTLYVFVFINSPDQLTKVFLPGGALASLSFSFAKHLRDWYSLKSGPINFLLVISKKAKAL